jgi:pectate lyase
MKGVRYFGYFLCFLFLSCGFSHAQKEKPVAFPGAEGFGKYATGGRGGEVLYVTNLNDDGPGSLREAIRKKGPRIVVFAVSGTIELESPLDINNPDITIAGQSAPGQGICVRNYSVNVKADNVIIRYMRFRMGDEKKYEGDALSGNKGHSNMMIDHCSMSWSTDECASFYRNKDFTLQWCIISESLNNSVHSKGPHGYGGIWGGVRATFHHNLLASNKSRNPRFSGSPTTLNTPDELVDFRNNVIFNWEANSTYGGEKGHYNMVNNYYKPGPATEKSKSNRIVNPWMPYGKFYIHGNIMEGDAVVSNNNWNGGVQPQEGGVIDSFRTNKPFEVLPIQLQSAKDAFQSVINKAGANLYRDAADERIIKEIKSGKAPFGKDKNGIIDSQRDVGGWPELLSENAPKDDDRDGMPDEWEKAHHLDPSQNDAALYSINKNYTNIEVYLNSIVEKIY